LEISLSVEKNWHYYYAGTNVALVNGIIVLWMHICMYCIYDTRYLVTLQICNYSSPPLSVIRAISVTSTCSTCHYGNIINQYMILRNIVNQYVQYVLLRNIVNQYMLLRNIVNQYMLLRQYHQPVHAVRVITECW